MTGEQPELDFAAAKARATDPVTSHQAAASVRNVTEVQRAIVHAFVLRGPMTHDQVHVALKELGVQVSPSGCRTRCSELVVRGQLVDSGEKAKLPSGRNAIVWQAAA